MDEAEFLKKVVRDQNRMLEEKNRLLSDMEYRLKQNTIEGSRKENLARYQLRLSRDTIHGQASLLKTILASIPYGLIVVDRNKRIVSYNQFAQKILEMSGQEIMGKPCTQVFGQSCSNECLLEGGVGEGKSECSRRVTFQTQSGRERILSLNVTAIRNKQGTMVGGVEIFSDISEDAAGETQPQNRHDSMVTVLSRIMERKDDYIVAHSKRVKNLALRLAQEVGMSGAEEQVALSYACLLHDIGLLAVPDEIRHSKKAGAGKPQDLIRTHPVEGEWMLSNVEGLGEIKKIVRSHHEHYDGEGYPDGLAAETIPYASRIIGLVEAYDAMMHDQAAERRDKEEIWEEIEQNRGSQFDPALVDVFLKKVVGDAS